MPDKKLSHLDYLEDEIYNNSGVNFVVGERPDGDLLFVQDVYPNQFNSMMKELTQFTAKYHDQALKEIEAIIKETRPKGYEIDPATDTTTYEAGWNDGIEQYEDWLIEAFYGKETK